MFVCVGVGGSGERVGIGGFGEGGGGGGFFPCLISKNKINNRIKPIPITATVQGFFKLVVFEPRGGEGLFLGILGCGDGFGLVGRLDTEEAFG